MTRIADTIDRLFDELVHEVWRPPVPTPPARIDRGAAVLELELPGADVRSQDVTFSIDGQHLTVAVRQRAAEHVPTSGATLSRTEEHQRTVTLPSGTQPAGFEVRFEAGVLRVRVPLRSRPHE